jgi:hypothetical protein
MSYRTAPEMIWKKQATGYTSGGIGQMFFIQIKFKITLKGSASPAGIKDGRKANVKCISPGVDGARD